MIINEKEIILSIFKYIFFKLIKRFTLIKVF
jgi:hypothetical protein